MHDNTIVVTRHKDLIELLKERNLITNETLCIDHTDTLDDIKNKDVIGVVPAKLAIFANTVTEVKLNIPRERRGLELPLEELRNYASEAFTYKVKQVETRTDFSEAVLGSSANTFIKYVVRHNIIARRSKAHLDAAKRNEPIKKTEILGKPFVGHLPYWLAQWTLDMTTVGLYYEYERRGLVHTLEEMLTYNPELITYTVTRLK
jgi:hypothetical protein